MKPHVEKDELSEIEILVLRSLNYGKATATPLKVLVGTIHKGERVIRLAIENLRHKRYAIISCEQGYFICQTREELEEFVAYNRKELISRCIMLREVKKGAKEYLEKTIQLPMYLS